VSHPTTRVLAMLELLQARQRMGGAELAGRLGVDERTVRRYAARLADLGIPVTAERGRYGGYRLMPGFKLPPLMFTDDEATAVVLGLLAAGRLGLPVTGAASALAKVQRVLPAALGERIEALRQTLEFTTMPREAVAADTGTVLALAHAAGLRQRVRLRYRSWAGADSERDLDPYGLVLHSGRWYVTGHDSRSGQVRTFRVDRVRSVRPGDETFEPPQEFQPVRHVTEALAAVPYAHEVEVVLATTMDAARRRIPPTAATLTETEDGVLLSARAERLDGLAAMLAGLGWPFTIRKPAALRGEVRALSDRLRAWGERERPG
jgi:predicted DNA-binding transcriptional regulator YafY